MKYGVDVSRFQNPRMIPDNAHFVIARGSSGSKVDTTCIGHLTRGREIGADVGGYHFFFEGAAVEAQREAYNRAADEVKLSDGDIIPFVDVEAYPVGGSWERAKRPNPGWCDKLKELTDLLARDWGQCGVYITQRDWGMLGATAWLLDIPLWVAHWIGPRPPATPGGRPATIHQYRVGPWSPGAYHEVGGPKHPMAIDHNRAQELPLIDPKPSTHPVGDLREVDPHL